MILAERVVVRPCTGAAIAEVGFLMDVEAMLAWGNILRLVATAARLALWRNVTVRAQWSRSIPDLWLRLNLGFSFSLGLGLGFWISPSEAQLLRLEIIKGLPCIVPIVVTSKMNFHWRFGSFLRIGHRNNLRWVELTV